VRLPVVCSIIAHAALLLIALRLPAREMVRAPKTIDVEIREATRPPRAVEPAPQPPKPVALRPPTPRERQRPQPLPTPVKPPQPIEQPQAQPPPQPQPPSQPSALSMRPSAPVDLNLHNLSGVLVQPGRVSGGEGGPAGTLAAATPARKPWKPRGDAGDPLLGKLPEEKEERFPLTLEGDGYHYNGPSFSATIAMDGRVSFDEHNIRDFKGLSGGFDITDLAMKAKKQDPYRYEKEKFMETTAKLRGELTTRARRERLESALATLPAHLEQVWSDVSRPARERRHILYTMWREAAGSDDEVGAAGRKARAAIEGFIRERLPEGSADGYVEDELRRLNARSGAWKFDPYKSN
jgi:hypothetical protein